MKKDLIISNIEWVVSLKSAIIQLEQSLLVLKVWFSAIKDDFVKVVMVILWKTQGANSMNKNFGKYNIPLTLQKIINFQNVLADPEQVYLGLHFYLSLENFRYFNTPSDVVVFGNIGVDGIHFGFLTDYSSITDLELAPIVCICPMDFERPTRIVANNLREFLRVNMTDKELFYNQFESEENYSAVKKRWAEEALYQLSENDKLVKEKVTKLFLEKLLLPIIDNPYLYVRSIELDRQSKVSIQTQDGLGITTPLLPGEKQTLFQIQPHTEPNLELLKKYLYSAPVASRLALFRDIQLNYVLHDHLELHEIVVKAMINMGLTDEARRLSEDI